MTTHDYFTRAEFRTFAKDPGAPTPTHTDAQIDAAQEATIALLEDWGHAAWPNVTGSDGDGTAAAARSWDETLDGPDSTQLLSRAPVIAITSIKQGYSDPLDVDPLNYVLDKPTGRLFFSGGLADELQTLHVVYTFGFTSCPSQIKLPAMSATKRLCDLLFPAGTQAGVGGIPENVVEYVTEQARFVFDKPDTLAHSYPWPWAPSASSWLRSYWDRHRARTVAGV